MYDEIFIPAGEFIRGTSLEEEKILLRYGSAVLPIEKPQRKIYLDAYYIDKYPLTNQLYAKFVKATGYRPEGTASGIWKDYYDIGKELHPVVSVSLNDIWAYCQWASKRLPTEAEWEKAARGVDGRLFPWGNEPDQNKCNAKIYRISSSIEKGIGIAETTPVNAYPDGKSPFGCYDMMGNVWEFVADWLDVSFEGQENYYSTCPAQNPQGPLYGTTHVMRGGAFSTLLSNCRCAFRIGPDSSTQFDRVGFRCARS